MKSEVPPIRVRVLNDQPIRGDGQYVLYWMVANRRAGFNFSLQRAIDYSLSLQRPLLVVEALRCEYRWANDRIHRFIIQGMQANQLAFSDKPVNYYPYLQRTDGEGAGFIERLAADACVIVSDDFPCFFIPGMLRLASSRSPVLFEAVDSNGLLPMRRTDRVFSRAHDFRRFIQKTIHEDLTQFPKADPFHGVRLSPKVRLDRGIGERWPRCSAKQLKSAAGLLTSFDIDHSVGFTSVDGGAEQAEQALSTFLGSRIQQYEEHRNHPDENGGSGLSPYLHFGHLSVHQVFEALVEQENWNRNHLAEKATGKKEGWWGMNPNAEAFLDELITWREVGFNRCCHQRGFDRYESLPEWARVTLEEAATDRREYIYDLEQFELAQTHDEVWNAAQRQLVREGRLHNYMRMLWGKKILQWTPHPRDALQVMIELNNKYALDGRNPNSYSGIFWVLGRYDRAWQRRPVFGKIRYMSSKNTVRKLRMREYLKRYRD